MLLDKNRNNPKIKEYRPIFVNTWLIMLQNYIDLRINDLYQLSLKAKNKRIVDEIKDKQFDYYNEGPGKLFKSILDFWQSTKSEIKKLAILVPNNKLVDRLKDHYIPKLIEIVIFEQQFKSNNSLMHFLKMLFRYDEITFDNKKMDINDPKLINMLPYIVKVAEKFMNTSFEYRDYALDFIKWIKCDIPLTCDKH